MTWFIAITNPNCHRRAEAELASLGYRAFWPKMRKWTSHARVKTPKEYPILGRYLFVEVDEGEGQSFWTARKVNGIEDFLRGMDRHYAPVQDEVVYEFMRRYLSGEWDMIEREKSEVVDDETGEISMRGLPVGARIEIMEGEFEGLLTVVRGYNSRGRVKFLPPGKREFVFTREENARAA
jgi:transcription antitermination factor NusG